MFINENFSGINNQIKSRNLSGGKFKSRNYITLLIGTAVMLRGRKRRLPSLYIPEPYCYASDSEDQQSVYSVNAEALHPLHVQDTSDEQSEDPSDRGEQQYNEEDTLDEQSQDPSERGEPQEELQEEEQQEEEEEEQEEEEEEEEEEEGEEQDPVEAGMVLTYVVRHCCW